MSVGIPAIAGAAQVIQRPGTGLSGLAGPLDLMAEAALSAAADAGSDRMLLDVEWLGVAGGYWRYRDPGALVAEMIGCRSAKTALSSISGSAPQEMVGRAADLIARGQVDVALVVGGEARYSSKRLKRAGQAPPWSTAVGEGNPELVPAFPDDAAVTEEFRMFGVAAPAYALMSDSMRVADGETVGDHRSRLADLWARFSQVAARNPFAWHRQAHSVEDIRDARPDNRMIAFPYTKAMVANNDVDMASAVLLCSTTAARRFGVALDRMVFPHAVTKAHETWLVVERNELHGSPALAAAGTAALRHAGIGPDDVEHIDLYACFPAVVRMSARALGFGMERQLTVTGGLGFAGAAVGNATGQSIAAMVPLLRAGGWGVVHGNGGHATKHAFGVYSNTPPRQFIFDDCQASVVQQNRMQLARWWSGEGTVEAATVVFDRNGPSHVLAAMRGPGPLSASRGWATSTDPGMIKAMMTSGLAGETVRRAPTGEIER